MKAISEMTYHEIIISVLEKAGIEITRDGTGMAFIAIDKEGKRIAGVQRSPKLLIYDILTTYIDYHA